MTPLQTTIYNSLKNLEYSSPLLLLEDAVLIFKENYHGSIYTINSDEDLQEFIYIYSNSCNSKPVVLDGISNISNQTLLASFLEKIEFPIILLSIKDNISSILLSRVNTIIKETYNKDKCNLLPANEALEAWNMSIDKSDIEKFYANESPELFYLKTKSEQYVCNTKIVDLLSLGGA